MTTWYIEHKFYELEATVKELTARLENLTNRICYLEESVK